MLQRGGVRRVRERDRIATGVDAKDVAGVDVEAWDGRALQRRIQELQQGGARGLIGVSITRGKGIFALLQLAFYSPFGRQVCDFAFCTRKDWMTKKGNFVFDNPLKSATFVPSRAGCTKTRNFLQDNPRNMQK